MKANVWRITAVIVAAAAAFFVIAAIAVCAVFPNKYAQKVNAAADEFGLDRALVRAVVWAESRFDANAVSKKGAAGLMQLMPETYNMCANALGIENKDGGKFDPENSLRCGCYYLSVMRDKFDGDMTAALMAYNAGEANAKKFLSGADVFPETKKYLDDIKKARRVYGLFGGG